MEIFSFFRSGTSYRLRIALNLKNLSYDYYPVDLRTDAHRDPTYLALNPQGLAPALKVDGKVLIQSPAIIEWLEETYPEPPLLPRDAAERAHVRALAAIIGCDVHPLNNLRVLRFLRQVFHHGEEDIGRWCARWVTDGLDAFEQLVHRGNPGKFCHGDSPTLADVYLIPQLVGGRRLGVDVSRFETLLRIERVAMELDAFQRAAAERQPDAV